MRLGSLVCDLLISIIYLMDFVYLHRIGVWKVDHAVEYCIFICVLFCVFLYLNP
jgi:hypothetical protein